VKKRNVLFFSVFFVLGLAGCVTAPHKVCQQPAPGQTGVYHTVSGGQTLWRIARIYNVDLRELMRVNGISDPGQLVVGQRLLIPGALPPPTITPQPTAPAADLERIVGPKHDITRWKTITIHHSGTLSGNAAAFDRNHRKRGMGGLFYHFVIGNGRGSGDGEVEVGWRWIKQCPANRPNDIQICLVGDFDRERVTGKQFGSLIKLISVLRRQYNIPLRGIRKHKSIAGKHTACPGSCFPFEQLISELRKIQA
jgi:LysM repeat protein